MKKIWSLLLVLCMATTLFSAVPITVSAETSGTCGANLTWTLDANGTLTISGTGEMTDFERIDDIPWFSKTNLYGIKEINIGKGITKIGESAFSYGGIEQIIIPEGVEQISSFAFAGCKYLQVIEIPRSVTKIGFAAFNYLDALTDIYYGGNEYEWKQLSLDGKDRYGQNYEGLRNANIHFNSKISDKKTTGTVPYRKEISVRLNDKEIQFDQPPVIRDGRTLVPLRAIFEAMGATVDWNNATQTVTSKKGSTTISLTIGSSTMYKNDATVYLDVPAQLVGGRTMVPVRAIAEAFGADVRWDENTRTIYINLSINTHGIIVYADSKYNEVSAMSFLEALKSNQLGSSNEDIYCLYEPTEDEYSHIISAVSQNAKDNDITYFYYAGHGDDDGGIYPDYNSDSLSETYMRTPEQLIANLSEIRGTVVIILESCHSGCIQNVENIDRDKFKIITSSRDDQYSDTDHIGVMGFIKNRSLGAFSEALLNGIGGLEGNNIIYNTITSRDGKVKADYNDDHNVTIEELYTYINENMDQEYLYKGTKYYQNPTCSNADDDTIIYSY